MRKLATKQGRAFAAVNVEDLGGTAEVTVWPDQYEEQQGLLVHGNVLLAKVEVRERGDRLTLAVEELAAYDQDAGRPLNFNPIDFVPQSGRRRRWRGNGSRNGGPSNNGPGGGGGVDNSRPDLRAVPTSEAPAPSASPAPEDPSLREGPSRLRITMDETSDHAADKRRLGRIMRIVEQHPGEERAELVIVSRGGQRTLLALPGVDEIEAVAALVRPLLGVLGNAELAGEDASAAESEARVAVASVG